MAIVVTAPEKVGFSKDNILWRFEDDRAGIIPGIPSETILAVSNVLPVGSQIVFRWGDKDLRFTAAETPGPYGSEFPPYPVYEESTKEAYIKSLVPYFKNNYFLDQDFLIAAEEFIIEGPLGNVSLWAIKFTARKAGIEFNLMQTRFVGGGVTPSVVGTDDSTVPNNSVFVEVWMQSPDGSVFERKYAATQPFDDKSIAEFDASAVLHSSLATELPDMTLPVAQRCPESRRKYYLRYALYGGANPSIGPIQQTDEHIVLLGGFKQWKKGPESVQDAFTITDTQYQLLTLRDDKNGALRAVRTNEPVFVSWVNFGAAGRNVHARATITFADGTTQTTNTGVVSAVGQFEKLMFGVGFSQLNLSFFNNTGKFVSEYTVQLRDDLGPVSSEYRMVVNYQHLEYVRYFAYVNSYGSIETLLTYGKGSESWKIFKEQAQAVLPYNFGSDQAQFVEWNATYQDNQQVATGWMRKKDLSLWLDLFISGLKYRVIKGSPYAIQIGTDTIQRGTDGDNQYGIVFDYQFARIFDSINEEILEGEDSQDVIPPNVLLAGQLNRRPQDLPAAFPAYRIDPYPVQGSQNPITSDAVHRIIQQLQKKLPQGSVDEYYNGEGSLRNLRTAVNAVEKDPTVPGYAKSLTGFDKIFNELQASSPGLNVKLFDGQLAEWYIERMTHPAFYDIPHLVIQRGVQFEKFLDLSIYKSSYHNLSDLTVDIKYNSLLFEGIEVTAEGLVLRVAGTIDREFTKADRIILNIKDQNGNSTPVAVAIESLREPDPDNRPVCQKGPFHWPNTPITIISNGSIAVPYDAEGVNPLEWVIANNTSGDQSSFIRNGESGPVPGYPGAHILCNFSPLPGGRYYVGFRGVLCKSNWEFREVNLPVSTTITYSDTYPKHVSQGSDSKFLVMIQQSAQALLEVLNKTTGVKVYSQVHDFVADVTEIEVLGVGGWPEADYEINTGTASATLRVGEPPVPVTTKFQLLAGSSGSMLKNLAEGQYEGPVPNLGFNILFESTSLGFSYQYYEWFIEFQLDGEWLKVDSAGGAAVSQSPANWVQVLRMFNLGVDSRSINFQGQSLNRFGLLRANFRFHTGTTPGSPLAGSFQQTIKLHKFEILGSVKKLETSGRLTPVIGKVTYDGQNVQNNNVWAEPFASQTPKLEYSTNGGTTWFRDVSATPDNFGDPGSYSNIWILNNNPTDNFPTGQVKQVIFRNPAIPSVISNPITVNNGTTTPGGEPVPLGTYETVAGGRKFIYSKSPDFELRFNPDGTLSNVTPGLIEGNPDRINGRTMFYMINYGWFVNNGDGAHIYTSLKNIWLTDRIYTIRMFSCDASKIPNLEAFKAGISGYGANAVNKYNATLSEITVSIRTINNPGIPPWLIPSRKLNFGDHAKNRAYNNKKLFASGGLNYGDPHSKYHAKGANTGMVDDDTIDQPYSFRTFKWGWDGLPLFTNEQLHGAFRGFIEAYGLTKDTAITDEFPENAQGTDPTIYERVVHCYRGAMEKFRETEPGLDKKDTNLYGPYGIDKFTQTVNQDTFTYGTKAHIALSLDEHVHSGFNMNTGAWDTNPVAYYSSGQIDYRNINLSYYMYNDNIRLIPYELIYCNERVKIGTKTFGGQDREAKWAVFSTTLCQTLAVDENGNLGVEDARTGDVIPFPNGEILSRYNTPSAAVAGEYYDLGFWATFIGNGIMLWGGDTYGQDPTKIRHYEPADQPIFWTRNGGSREEYQSGQNGAPVNDPTGVYDLLYAVVIDNCFAGYSDARDLEGYDETIYFASYSSSRKSFTPTPGSTGLHLNGFGPLNMGSLSFVDARDQKAAMAVVGVGSLGKVAVYYNGFLAPHEYEDNVTVTHAGQSVNLGRVYGRTTKFQIF